MFNSKLVILLILLPTLLWAEEANKQSVINRITGGISNTFGNLTSFDGIKKADLEIETKDTDFQSDFRASVISSLSEKEMVQQPLLG